MAGFQTTVYTDPAPAVEGDFASANPRRSLLAQDGEFVAGAAGVVIGRFAWVNTTTNTADNFMNGGVRLGFVGRVQPALVTPYLAQSTLTVQPGVEITLYDGGDFWARFAAGATEGQKVYANTSTGVLTAAAAGSPSTSTVTANTTNGSPTLTVTAGTGLAVGQPISGTNIPAGAYITALGTGTGGAGTYTMSANATGTATGTTVTLTLTVETNWTVQSTSAAGELSQISTARIS